VRTEEGAAEVKKLMETTTTTEWVGRSRPDLKQFVSIIVVEKEVAGFLIIIILFLSYHFIIIYY